ncbi:MAG: hypothetical protein LBE55_01310 [Clostridiales bacterium]|jgi:hypothetical protein|nr:hypothetical protein [Clostridiales bacterium]
MANLRAATVPPSDMKAPRKGKTGLIVMLVIIALILGFIALVAFNVFGLRDNMLYPLLRNVPLVGEMIPAPAYAEADAQDLAAAMAELETEAQNLLAENALLEAQVENLTGMVEALESEVAHLEGFAYAYNQFLVYREAFYRDLAMENPDAFLNFFETTQPELAQELFLTLALARDYDERWSNYLASWSNMHHVQVAMVIESMLTTDMRLIVDVMRDLPEPFRGNILNSMAPESAAAVLRQSEP